MALQARQIPSPERERWLDEHLPYRIQLLDGLKNYNAAGAGGSPLRQVFPGIFEGELVGCRWTMSFLGIYLAGSGDVRQVTDRRQATDVFAIDVDPRCQLLDPAALSQEQQRLLSRVFRGANVASAHPVREGAHSMAPEQVEEAATLLVAQIQVCVYDALGVAVPSWRG